MDLKPHSVAWYARLATQLERYVYPWRSILPDHHGEDDYIARIAEHITPETDMLDVACAHGDVALHFAPHCRSVLAYDVTEPWIELARQRAAEQGQTNVTFICHDSSLDANGGSARLPAADASYNLLTCSKGPFHWIEDARRVARPPATLLMLVPDAEPAEPWYTRLPDSLRPYVPTDPNWARPSIERRLTTGGLTLDSWWSYDVPEALIDVEALYAWLTFGKDPARVPPLDQVAPTLEAIFQAFAGSTGLTIRHRRFIWQAIVK